MITLLKVSDNSLVIGTKFFYAILDKGIPIEIDDANNIVAR